MNKHTHFDKPNDWYEMWMQQSKNFFESADEHLKSLFSQDAFADPEAHLKQVHAWLESLKARWQQTQQAEANEQFKPYWQMVTKMYQDSADLMLKEWLQRTRSSQPITNMHDLYELWLNSCHQVYQQTQQSQRYQEMYGDMMNAALQFWQQATNKG